MTPQPSRDPADPKSCLDSNAQYSISIDDLRINAITMVPTKATSHDVPCDTSCDSARCQNATASVSSVVEQFIKRALEEDPAFISRPLSELNTEAVALHKAGNHVAAAAAFAKLFERARVKNLVHAELHVCYRCSPAAPVLLTAAHDCLAPTC